MQIMLTCLASTVCLIRKSRRHGPAPQIAGVALDLAADAMNDAAKTGAQELERAGSLELMGMGVTSDHDRRPLGHAQIALAQLDSLAFGRIDREDR
jgi:hypothetical protein